MNFIGRRYSPSRFKFHFDLTLGKMLQPEARTPLDRERPYLRAANVLDGEISMDTLKTMWFSPADSAKYDVKPGDLMVLEGGDVGRCAIWELDSFDIGFQNSVHRIRPLPGNSNRFAFYWLKHLKSAGYFELICSKATLAHFTVEKVRDTPFPAIDLSTQRSISDFLDRETSHLDQLINKKLTLVQVLKEKRSAEINRLLLGRDVPGPMTWVESCKFTNSIPSSWQMRRLKALCSHLGNGFVGPTRDILIDGDEQDAVPYIQSTHIKQRRIDFDKRPYFVSRSWLAAKPKARIKTNDLLIVQTGDCGATAIVDDQFNGSGCHALIVARPDVREVDPRLLLHLLTSAYGRGKLAEIQTGALHPHLEVGFVKDVSLPIPPRDQQELLVLKLDTITEHLDLCVAKTQATIDRLQELRSALITAAVTGQIDVNEWARHRTSEQRLDDIEGGACQ